jgi:hypothetical protein
VRVEEEDGGVAITLFGLNKGFLAISPFEKGGIQGGF